VKYICEVQQRNLNEPCNSLLQKKFLSVLQIHMYIHLENMAIFIYTCRTISSEMGMGIWDFIIYIHMMMLRQGCLNFS